MLVFSDLNSPPLEIHEQEASSGSRHPAASQGTSDSINHRSIYPTGQHQRSAPQPYDVLDSSLIDVDAIEDEVQMLSSPRGFPQGRNHSRRNEPVTVVLDEDLDTSSRISEGSATILSLNDHNEHQRSSRNISVINCELYPAPEEESNVKGKNVMETRPEPPREPAFICPICMDTLVEPSSTICGHIFCCSCIKASVKSQKKCPTCQRKLSMSNFHRVYLPTTTD
ncbi:zinc finger, C3HC4 type, domain containing protein [Musa troglodytarum]|uniref:Zinc finger, C3HC4 type, domain containing protein n=1 Tax=Musa troglodytarum TaxID=320322 RepID=A0A9E7I8J9_9LILI|nr:zinc finger, C3HC4 type, domain containing protein [Musa troglodytarum]